MLESVLSLLTRALGFDCSACSPAACFVSCARSNLRLRWILLLYLLLGEFAQWCVWMGYEFKIWKIDNIRAMV